MDSELSVVEKLGFSTIRIECETALGRSTGTGFFFRFADEGSRFVPGIVTNKHVVAGGTSGRLHFTLSTTDGKPDVGSTFQWNISGGFMNAWVHHPDPGVDLCVLPIATLIEQAAASGKHFFFTFLDTKLIPSDADIEQFIGMERVVMIGYPNGIWDSRHNFPVFRAGVAATHYRYDWNGRPEFLIALLLTSRSRLNLVLRRSFRRAAFLRHLRPKACKDFRFCNRTTRTNLQAIQKERRGEMIPGT